LEVLEDEEVPILPKMYLERVSEGCLMVEVVAAAGEHVAF
jgi:hypothetical protein